MRGRSHGACCVCSCKAESSTLGVEATGVLVSITCATHQAAGVCASHTATDEPPVHDLWQAAQQQGPLAVA